jgi:hypothetical protein
MNLSEALTFIDGLCESYINGSVDEKSFRESLEMIPAELWQDENSSLSMINVLVENVDLYDISIPKHMGFAEFICGFIPDSFWSNKAGIYGLMELVANYLSLHCEYVSQSDFEAIMRHFPTELWDDRGFALRMCDIITEWAHAMEGLNCVDELLPESFFENEENVRYTVLSLCEANDFNATDFRMYPSAAWKHSEIILLILSNLEEKLEADRYHFTMYPNFRGSNRDYLEMMFEYIPQSFKTDESFILEVLEYDYFSDAFEFLYEWIDKKLVENKEFVLKVWEIDEDVIEHVSDKLSDDEDVKRYIEENIDVDWILKCFPNKKIPQWIKELRESF